MFKLIRDLAASEYSGYWNTEIIHGSGSPAAEMLAMYREADLDHCKAIVDARAHGPRRGRRAGHRDDGVGAAMSFKIAVDTGGTFSDVVLADDRGSFSLSKAPTTPGRIFEGIAQRAGSRGRGARARPAASCSPHTDVLIYATTRSTNAILTGDDGAHGADHDQGLPGHARLPRGRQAAAVRLPPALSRAVHPEAADVRDAASGSRPRARSCAR